MHTNPILITFCSILYYKDLDEYLHRFRAERRTLMKTEKFFLTDELVVMKTFGGRRLSLRGETKRYNRLVVNRWHLWLRLSLNREITYMRRNNLICKREDSQTSFSMIARIKSKVRNLSIKKKNESVICV